MNTHEWRQQGTYFKYLYHRIFYRVEGKGQILLLIHGFPTSSWDWHKVWPSLSGHFKLIAPDMIGFGWSDKPRDHPYSLLDQADLHEKLLKHLGVDAVHVLAHDYGDSVAQELLARQQEEQLSFRMKSLCLLNGGIFPECHRPRLIQRLLISPVGRWLAPFLNKKKLRSNFIAIFGKDTPPTKEEIDGFWSLIQHQEGKKIAHKLIRYMKERNTYRSRWVGALQEASLPLRLIIGPEDPISGRHVADHFRELIPGPDIVLLEGIGHYPQVEAPNRLVQHYLEFRTEEK